ncbi:5261_t:CDS:2, partial [Funneliformis geosporum]
VTIAPQYMRNSHILAKFIQSDEMTDIFPGEVLYYFEYSLDLSIESILKALGNIHGEIC